MSVREETLDTSLPASPPEAVLDHVRPGADVVVPIANGEPVGLLDALEDAGRAGRLRDVRIHQMHAIRDRDYLHGKVPGLRHVAYFLSHHSRAGYAEGHVDLVPNHFSEVPSLLRDSVEPDLVVAAAAPPNDEGFFSLGLSAAYTASFIGRAPFFLEVNPNMPRTFGSNRIHESEVVGWTRGEHPLVEAAPAVPGEVERAIGGYVAERVPDGAALQAGIGAIPNAVLSSLHDRRELTIHTELISDGLMDLMASGAVSNSRGLLDRNVAVTTFALGTERLYRWLDGRRDVEFHPVEWVNDPRVVGSIPRFVSVNSTVEVDLYGQCASETIGGRYYSSSGGQADFARGAKYSEGGKNFIVLPSTAKGGTISRIQVHLSPGAVVTTLKNTIDHVVTEYGVAELWGRSLRERAQALIGIAHPDFRDQLTEEAGRAGILR